MHRLEELLRQLLDAAKLVGNEELEARCGEAQAMQLSLLPAPGDGMYVPLGQRRPSALPEGQKCPTGQSPSQAGSTRSAARPR